MVSIKISADTKRLNFPPETFSVVDEIVVLAKEIKFRATFDTYLKNYFDRLDLLFNENEVKRNHWIRAKRLGYLYSVIGHHYKDKLALGWRNLYF